MRVREKQAEKISIKTSKEATESFFTCIAKGLTEKKVVEIRKFGVFYIKEYQAKVMKNPKTGETIVLKKRRLPAFRESKRVNITEKTP